MFIITKIEHLVAIQPQDLARLDNAVIAESINTEFSNKVIHKVGLFVKLYELLWVSEGIVGHGKGAAHVNVEFTAVVFRAHKGEVLEGKITSASEQGIRLGIEFFGDIHVPPNLLFEGSAFNIQEQLWNWEYEQVDHFFDIGEVVRFRVEAETWHDTSPGAPMSEETSSERKVPYAVTASMAQGGLGLPAWW